MNILIDVGHPAHVHLFARASKIWQSRGHKVLFTIRDRPLIPELLKANNLPYLVASTPRIGKLGQTWELIEHDWNVLKAAHQFKADVMLGTSISITHVSKIFPAKSIVFNEDDGDVVKLFSCLAYPFADAIVIPEILRDKKTRKHFTYEGYHELAYLHPDHFSPDPGILGKLGIKEGEDFFILRLVAFNAHHDTGQAGLSRAAQLRLVNLLTKHGKVFINNEGKIIDELRPYQLNIPAEQIHHALYYAKMLISDGQTMTCEAAVLGTPSIRCNTFVGKISYLDELEHKYRLTFGFFPTEEEQMLAKIEEFINDKDLKLKWRRKQEVMLEEKIELSTWMVEFVEKF